MLSIIYVNYKTSDQITMSISSIINYDNCDINYEFIVVDNNSSDPGLKTLIEKFKFLKIINAEKNGGFAYGNNIGMKAAKGDCFLLLNPDTYVKDDSISKMYKRLQKDDSLHMIGPKLLYPDEKNQSFYHPKTFYTPWNLLCERFFLPKIFRRSKVFNSYLRTYMDYETESYVEQICGAALMLKRQVIKEIGWMDENFFMYFEESDFCRRAIEKKLKLLYYPISRIYHVGGHIDPKNWEKAAKAYVISFKYYFRKYYGFFTCLYVNIIYFLGCSLRWFGFVVMCKKKKQYYLLSMKYLFQD